MTSTSKYSKNVPESKFNRFYLTKTFCSVLLILFSKTVKVRFDAKNEESDHISMSLESDSSEDSKVENERPPTPTSLSGKSLFL